MDIQSLINKTEYQANKFKQRAYKGPGDEKRHDPIQLDEQKCLWIAHMKLGWSVAKIGSVFARDPRTVSKYLNKFNDEHHLKTKHQQDEQKQVVADRQAQHVKHLQELARTAIDTCPDMPNPGNIDEFGSKFKALFKVYARLCGDPYWPALATHLGNKGKEMEEMRYKLENILENMPWPWFNKTIVPDEYVQVYNDGYELIEFGDFMWLTNFGTTREWEYYGLKKQCHLCPLQD